MFGGSSKMLYLCGRILKVKAIMTIEDVKAVIVGDETRTLEVKKTTGELKDGMRSVCAFSTIQAVLWVSPSMMTVLRLRILAYFLLRLHLRTFVSHISLTHTIHL